jgi:nucleoside-diphosphate-sugar epimerase
MRVLLAGATGALGKRLLPLLLEKGYDVFGTTRSAEKARALERDGVHSVIVDVFDAASLRDGLTNVKPQLVFHMLTDLPHGTKPEDMVEGSKRNAVMRREGTRNLVAAALAAGAQKLIAESIAWTYALGSEPHSEDDPLDLDAAEPRRTTVAAVAELERAVLTSKPIAGVVLRYGELYGPGTGHEHAGAIAVHVDAAVYAALLAVDRVGTGTFNVVDDNAHISNAAARSKLGWRPDFRIA